MTSIQERLNKYTYVQDGHLLWGGGMAGRGYGVIRINGRMQLTHRVAWEMVHGEIPDGLCVLHTYDIPPCIEPEHLYLGTNADNTHDMMRAGNSPNANKTYCIHGHPFDEANTYCWGGQYRKCRICDKERARAKKEE